MEELEEQTERRTLTYSRWENQVKGKGREGWHPVTYTFSDATLQAIKDIQVRISLTHNTVAASPSVTSQNSFPSKGESMSIAREL
jgi:hypothetical protein